MVCFFHLPPLNLSLVSHQLQISIVSVQRFKLSLDLLLQIQDILQLSPSLGELFGSLSEFGGKPFVLAHHLTPQLCLLTRVAFDRVVQILHIFFLLL